MSDPLICCLLPFRENHAFVERAIRCFDSQDYPNKHLLMLDTSPGPMAFPPVNRSQTVITLPGLKATVGALRNVAIAARWPVVGDYDIVAHFDYDDVSMPERLTKQLRFMEETGASVVGLFDMLFYDAIQDRVFYYDSLMKNYGLGTSLFYKREVWERVPFPDQTPEDTTWQHQVGHDNIRGCSSIVDGKPLMIQVLHGANAAASAAGAIFQPANPELDAKVREILKTA